MDEVQRREELGNCVIAYFASRALTDVRRTRWELTTKKHYLLISGEDGTTIPPILAFGNGIDVAAYWMGKDPGQHNQPIGDYWGQGVPRLYKNFMHPRNGAIIPLSTTHARAPRNNPLSVFLRDGNSITRMEALAIPAYPEMDPCRSKFGFHLTPTTPGLKERAKQAAPYLFD